MLPWEEIDRLRRLVPIRPDFHLANWAAWARRYRCEHGYRTRSTGLAGTGLSSADDLAAECDAWAAEIADTVVEVLPIQSRMAIAAVYLGSEWRLRADLLGSTLVEAAELFWIRAKRKGLL